MKKRTLSNYLALTAGILIMQCSDRQPELAGESVRLSWEKNDSGWTIGSVAVRDGNEWKSVGTPSGEHFFLYSENKPDSTLAVFKTSTGVVFPEPIYHYQKRVWAEATHPVTLNTSGEAFSFVPQEAKVSGKTIVLSAEHELATIESTWELDDKFSSDVKVTQTLIAKRPGYYSVGSPSLSILQDSDIAWATVPGYFQSNSVKGDFLAAYAYGHGIPDKPVLYRERIASTLAVILETKDSVSLAITPAPGLARDPWANDRKTHSDWSVALSHRNRSGDLTPTLYYPVLGQPKSKLNAGDTIRFEFRFTVKNGNWYETLKHTINDVYSFREGLALRKNKQSLSDRIRKMHQYVTDTQTSMWKVESFEGTRIGAQAYLGGVVGSDKDAMKNADYGAMWMLATATDDPFLRNNVLPYALNFKLKQQETKPGFFQGSATGQYYLAKKKAYVEEWGEFIEPISLTYYVMLDVGNLLLFEPDNAELKKRLRLGADRLLDWQLDDGSWVVAYDRKSHEALFPDIKDLRPTFYGLIVAYRILKDERYLEAARKGADWIISNAVNTGHFIGVCGDARYAPDFATGQTAQAMLDLFELTGDKKYRDAAIRTARLYTTSIYTHPIPSKTRKIVNGVELEDWEIAQAGLSFEHAGLMGSAQSRGPIQLASHAGMFVRIFGLTRDSLFLDMARSAAVGRDAFVDPKTSVASYYWDTMNRGAGPYPHHAWWQIGWITDYLMAEAELRSNGQVTFPRGFVAPKVGPHQTYGFEPGTIEGKPARLIVRDGLVEPGDPNIEYISAISPSGKELYVVLMNAVGEPMNSTVELDVSKINKGAQLKSVVVSGNRTTDNRFSVPIPPYGLQICTIQID